MGILLPAWPAPAGAVDKTLRFGTQCSRAQNAANSCRPEGAVPRGHTFWKRGRSVAGGGLSERSTGHRACVCMHVCMMPLCTSAHLCVACAVCALSARMKPTTAFGGTLAGRAAFDKFPARLQMSRGSESPLADDLISTISQPRGQLLGGGLLSWSFGAEGHGRCRRHGLRPMRSLGPHVAPQLHPADPPLPHTRLFPCGAAGRVIPRMMPQGDRLSQVTESPGGQDPADGVGSLVMCRHRDCDRDTGFLRLCHGN